MSESHGDFTTNRAVMQYPPTATRRTVSDLLDQTQALEDLHGAALAFHWRRLFEVRARRRQLETLAFGGRR